MTGLEKFLKDNSIKFVNFQFTDLFGKTHGVTYNVNEVDTGVSERISFQEKVKLIPDIQTVFYNPFCAQATAVILCSVVTSGTPYYSHDSRSVAKKARDYTLSTKIADAIQFSFEIGFSVFDKRVNNSYINLNCDFASTIDPLSDLRSEILLMMMETGIKPLCHRSISPSQGLIQVGSSDFLNSADNVQKSKNVIHNVAHSYGKIATFMPKPIAQGKGNSLCLYQLLLKDDESLFNTPGNYSYYVGGIIKHIKAINAYSNPTTNSYKRLMDLPSFSLQSKHAKISFPDPSANPYLCFAAILMAGLDGIENKIDPNQVENKTAKSLSEALEALDTNREFLLKGAVFTNEQIDQYIRAKREEVKKIENSIHPAEFAHYYNA